MADKDTRVEKFELGFKDLKEQIGRVIVGQEDVIRKVLICILSKGHCIITGVPGLAKTTLVRTLSNILGIDFSRVQFTPDLMPSDIIGTEILQEDPKTRERTFRFIQGPIFTNLLLADEVNRASPKTQSALLESMQERTVTVAGKSYKLSKPFFVMATQNPIEQEGTYPLPEAQLDRFMFNIHMDYPETDEEREVIRRTTSGVEATVEKVLSGEDITGFQELARSVPVSEYAIEYAVELVAKTRPAITGSFEFINKWVSWGASPRASQYLILGAKAQALIAGRRCVTCDDIRNVAPDVLNHRIFINFVGEADGVNSLSVISKLLDQVKPRQPK